MKPGLKNNPQRIYKKSHPPWRIAFQIMLIFQGVLKVSQVVFFVDNCYTCSVFCVMSSFKVVIVYS